VSVVRKIIVLGDVILDRTVFCRIKGLSPENQNIFDVEEKHGDNALGGAGNVAANCFGLFGQKDGQSVLPLFLVAADDAGREITCLLNCLHVEYGLDRYYGGVTAEKIRYVTSSGQLLRISREGSGDLSSGYWSSSKSSLSLRLNVEIQEPVRPVVCLVDYDKGYFRSPLVTEIMVKLIGAQCPIIVDPGRHGHWERYNLATVIKANVKQAQAHYESHRDSRADLCPPLDSPEKFDPNEYECDSFYRSVAHRLQRLLDDTKVNYEHMVLTLGAGGLAHFTPNGEVQLMREPPCDIIDVTGAGDTVMAALAVGMAEYGHDAGNMAANCRFALKAANVAVRRRGTTVVHRKDVE